MLNLDRLRVLVAVSDHGSVAAAADSLDVSSSAVSQQLSRLEAEVGQQLIERAGRGVRLTEAASLLVGHATRLLRDAESIEGELNAFAGEVGGTVTIAAFATAARGIGPALVKQLNVEYPALRSHLIEMEPDDSLRLLMRGDIDIAIVQDWFNNPLLMPPSTSRLALFDDVVDLALPSNHRFARRREVALNDLLDEEWVTWPPGSICGDWLAHTFRLIDRQPNVIHTASEHATQLAFVAAGLGAAVIPRLGRGDIPPDISIVNVRPTLLRHVFAAWRTNTAKRSNVAAVQAALQRLTRPATRIVSSVNVRAASSSTDGVVPAKARR
jgi:DNA-binding transcriptional LysR family regulator